MRSRVRAIAGFAGAAVLVLWAGCGGNSDNDAPASGMTQAQRDSAIAASRLPGAGAVGRAIEVSDSAEARSDRLDEEYE